MQTKKTKSVPAFYTIAEAAAVARCSAVSITRRINDGTLKAWQPAGKYGSVLIPQGNLDAFIKARGEK